VMVINYKVLLEGLWTVEYFSALGRGCSVSIYNLFY
jgi:hypothetical protein